MTKRFRDSQRARVYKWEDAMFPGLKDGGMTLPECGDLIHRACRTFGKPLPRLRDGRGRRNAGGRPESITLPRWSRTVPVVLHETAHAFQPRLTAWHGPEFVAIYMVLLHRFHGRGFDLLQAAAVDFNVAWCDATLDHWLATPGPDKRYLQLEHHRRKPPVCSPQDAATFNRLLNAAFRV